MRNRLGTAKSPIWLPRWPPAQAAHRFLLLPTSGFVVGGAGIATGLLLILLAPGDEDADSDLETGDGVALGSVEPWLDPRSGGGLTMRWRW